MNTSFWITVGFYGVSSLVAAGYLCRTVARIKAKDRKDVPRPPSEIEPVVTKNDTGHDLPRHIGAATP